MAASTPVARALDPEPAGTPLPERLNALVAERWPFFADRIVAAADGGEAIRLRVPDRAERLRACLDCYCRARPGQDRRGLGSLWAQWYAVTVWPPLVAACLLLRRAPCFDDSACALRVDADACPTGLCIGAETRDADPAAVLEGLAREQAAPVCEAVAEGCAVSPRVPWSNVANVIGWTLGELEAVADRDTVAPGHELLARRRYADGTPNPLYLGSCVDASTGRPGRRVCCLRYRLDGSGYCGDCPVSCGRRGGS